MATRPRILWDPVEVLVREHSLGERREDDAADAELSKRVQQLRLDPAVEHRIGRLVDDERRAELAQDLVRLACLRSGVGRDADVERFPLPHGGVEGVHRLLERRLRVEAMRVEDVDVVEAHARERLVERREHVLARAPLAVGARPHVVPRLGGDDKFVTVGAQVLLEQAAERLLGRSVGRPVVVREIEVRDAAVERAPQHRARRLERLVAAEVLPEPQRDRRQLQAPAPAPPVRHGVVALVTGHVRHSPAPSCSPGRLCHAERRPRS